MLNGKNMYDHFSETTYRKLNAISVSSYTLVGVIENKFPFKGGNCFSVTGDDGQYYRIVNFVHENIEELIKLGTISFPIQILALSECIAVINDPRIEDEWYLTRFCEVCCPTSLLPLPQILKHDREEMRGDRETTISKDGSIIYVRRCVRPQKDFKLKGTWTIDVEESLESIFDIEKEITRILLNEIKEIDN